MPDKRVSTDGAVAERRPDGELSLDKVHDLVRGAILRGELEPGAIMSQVQMAQELGVSRTPLREALRLLQREGLVEAEPNRRVRVAPLSIADLEQLYTLRIVNEALGVRLTVPTMTPADTDGLRDLLAEMDRLAEERDPDRWEVPHREFHRRLVSGAGARPVRLLEELSDHSERYRRAYLDSGPRAWSTGPTEHAAILDACARGDAVEAAALLGRHLSRTALTVLMQIAPEHDPREIRIAVRSVMRADEPDASPLGR